MASTSPLTAKRSRERTCARILETATELFLERGYAAVPLSLIATQAGVTKSLLHHYFGDKRGLHSAVKDAAVARYAEEQRRLFSGVSETLESDYHASLHSYFSFLCAHPEVARLFALESFEGHYHPSAVEGELQQKGIAFVQTLQEGGVLRDDLEADMILAAFSALTEYWFINRGRVAALNKRRVTKGLDARYFQTLSKIFEAGLKG
ncbi:MAG: TetR/AcrR family transcriptional regulator [Gammaproteobacteria bacterium]|jgi:TetR/AcrR family transcriptional regulator|nr:TetR/AcrR family transcriptional regulator [Gammaproteobacteria bacterium]